MGETIFNSYVFLLCFHEKVNRGVQMVLYIFYNSSSIRNLLIFEIIYVFEIKKIVRTTDSKKSSKSERSKVFIMLELSRQHTTLVGFIYTSVDILLDLLNRNFILKRIYRASQVKFKKD